MLATRVAGVLGRTWNRIWFQPYDPLPAGLFRICFGVLLTLMYVALYPNWDRYFGVSGVLSLTDRTLYPIKEDWWSLFYWLPRTPFRAFWALGLIAALGFTVGWRTRLWTIVLFVLETSMIARNRFAINGEDLVGRMLLFYGCFAPLGAALSVDAWRARRTASVAREGTAPRALPPIWPIRLMQLNFAAVYVFSLPIKLTDDPAWRNGQAIYYSMVSNMWSRNPWPQHFYGAGSTVMTFFSILAEGSFPLLVWFSRTRPFAIAALACLHLGIAVMLKNVTFFSLTMVCSLWLFTSAAELRALRSRLQTAWTRARRLAAPLELGRSHDGQVTNR
jgi:hypothetical protein